MISFKHTFTGFFYVLKNFIQGKTAEQIEEQMHNEFIEDLKKMITEYIGHIKDIDQLIPLYEEKLEQTKHNRKCCIMEIQFLKERINRENLIHKEKNEQRKRREN